MNAVKNIPQKRTLIFRLIALSLPIVFIIVAELVLRGCNYGYDTSVFIPAPGNKDYLIFNPDASKPYFTDPVLATSGNREPFRRTKDPGTIRIFILGESTTIGYPYFHNGSFHRWLEYRLLQTNPGKRIELINIALTAVNSYTTLGFAREVAKQQPDAVLIYTGHNEYYGALGVGSTNRINGSRWLIKTLLWLRQWRTGQLLTRVVQGIRGLFTGKPNQAGHTRMELMVGDQQIAFGSVLYTRGIEQFRYNMDATLAILQRNHIPTFVSNLVSNLRDQRPLEADSLDPAGAQYNFGLATAAWQRGDYATAQQDFLLAKDLDALRFRAPDTLNEIIADLCKKYRANSHLADIHSAFDSAAEYGIPGNDLFLEHVHPNLTGYAIMSDVFYRSLRDANIFPPPDNNFTLQDLLATMPITPVDSLNGAFRVANLKNNWPFNSNAHEAGPPSRQSYHLATEESDLAYALAFEHLPWEEAMRQLYDYYSKTEDWTSAARVMEALCLEHPNDPALAEKTAMLYGKADKKEKAIDWFRQAFLREPNFEKARYLFVLCLQTDQPTAAMPYIDYAIANNATGMPLRQVRNATLGIIRLEQRLTRDTTNRILIDSIAETYERMGNHPAALKYRKTQK